MANTNAPYGFRSFGQEDGSSPTMGLQRLFILSSDANQYFTGDVVIQSSANAGYIGTYAGSTSAVVPAGIFAGCEYYSPSVGRVIWSNYFPGSVGSSSPCNAYLITDPEMQFVVQCSSGPLGQSAVGGNVNITLAQSSLGNTLNGISAMTINSGSVATGSSLPFRIVDLWSNFAPPGVNGTDNTTAFNSVIVAPNTFQRRAGVTGTST